ncbi:MAG: hypothetical protein IJN90_06005 [Bacilli bacterium]|nr:hypothetical protein [Bacilli bacterium]MBQ7105393.1 hypothetical protein [Bacilli bacterium]
MNFVFKHKKIFISLFSIIIVLLVSLVIYSNFFSDNEDEPVPGSSSDPGFVIKDADVGDGKIYGDYPTNKDVSEGENFSTDKKGNKLNKTSTLAKEHEVNGYVISDLYLTSSANTSDYCILMFNYKNTTDSKQNFNLFFKFYDKDGNIMHSLAVGFPSSEKDKVYSHSAQTLYPIIDAYDYEIEYIEY